MKKLEEDEKQIKIVMAEHEELVQEEEENLQNNNTSFQTLPVFNKRL